MTPTEMIEVITAFNNGGKIECKPKRDDSWRPTQNPSWNFDYYEYRVIQPSNIAPGHNPDKVTIEQLEVKDGWRLLDTDEIKGRKHTSLIECRSEDNKSWLAFLSWKGSSPECTYRTKLSREALAALDNIAKPAIAPGHNLHSLTSEQVGPDYKLIQSTDESPDPRAEYWDPSEQTWKKRAILTASYRTTDTYRVPLNPPKTKIPLGPADFPPGTILRIIDSSNIGWAAVTSALSVCIFTDRHKISYGGLAKDNYLRSLDGGKTWLPCYREE